MIIFAIILKILRDPEIAILRNFVILRILLSRDYGCFLSKFLE